MNETDILGIKTMENTNFENDNYFTVEAGHKRLAMRWTTL